MRQPAVKTTRTVMRVRGDEIGVEIAARNEIISITLYLGTRKQTCSGVA